MRLIDGDSLADVLTAISSIKVDTGRSEEWAVTVNAARQAIAQMPTIEPKKGKWRRLPMACYGGGTVIEYQCPFCGEQFIVPSNYCQECGADMRGEQP